MSTQKTPKVLVFGGTGPAGICLLRELLYRQHATIAYARNPSKIPEDLASNPLLEIIKGELSDTAIISDAVSKSTVILSLLGPNVMRSLDPAVYTGFYSRLLPLMREHNVRRIFAMGTFSIPQPEDRFSIMRWLVVMTVYLLANSAYRTIRGIERVFTEEGEGVDWTVYRIGMIPGWSDEASWRRDREDGDAFEGYVGHKGWNPTGQRRAALARWLVDAAEDGKPQWVGKMPAVSRLAGSKRKAA